MIKIILNILYLAMTVSTTQTPLTATETQLLIIGQGFIGAYVHDLLTSKQIPTVSTSTTGRNGTIKFVFDPLASDASQFEALPNTYTILVTFPIKQAQGVLNFIRLYQQTHPGASQPKIVLLGSTSAWKEGIVDRHSPCDATYDRLDAENVVLQHGGVVLNLAGLWGGKRQPMNWVERVAKSKEMLAAKTSLHLIHGYDVARVVLALLTEFTPGERWVLTDLHVYDWLELCLSWGVYLDTSGDIVASDQAKWVNEIITEKNIASLPRPQSQLGRIVSSTETWSRFKLTGPTFNLLRPSHQQ